MHISQFAGSLRCKHCGGTQRAETWPVSGDAVPFYYQDEPGNYTLELTCPHCGRRWYVVWDDNPGAFLPLTF